jgi:hypothetical protein
MVQQNADQAVHEAARPGFADKLAAMLAMDISLIDAKGIDARTPLHCAGTVASGACKRCCATSAGSWNRGFQGW